MNFIASGGGISRQIGQPLAQRAAGELALGFQRDTCGRTRIERFYQQGCLKVRLPRPRVPAMCEAVTMNISGGVAAGDRLRSALTLGPGARLCLASATAERVYRAAAGSAPARIAVAIALQAGARLDYLPQETILFDGFALDRTLTVELAEDAVFLGVESVIFGRQAMGEVLRAGWLRDGVTLRRDGNVLLRDMTRLEGGIARTLGRRAVTDGQVAMACIIYAAADAGRRLDDVRAALAGRRHAGATVLDGVLRVRILAPSAMLLRQAVVAALKICRDGQDMPRVWQS